VSGRRGIIKLVARLPASLKVIRSMRVEVLSGVERRRQWSDEKARIVEETLVPGARVAEVAGATR